MINVLVSSQIVTPHFRGYFDDSEANFDRVKIVEIPKHQFRVGRQDRYQS